VFWKQNSPTSQDTAGIEHINGLFSYALVLTRNRSEAEDLVQETYVRAIGAMGRLRPESNMKSWMLTFASDTLSLSEIGDPIAGR
jgi:RNA polymerase sigma-70 factor (ECF subfamily)